MNLIMDPWIWALHATVPVEAIIFLTIWIVLQCVAVLRYLNKLYLIERRLMDEERVMQANERFLVELFALSLLAVVCGTIITIAIWNLDVMAIQRIGLGLGLGGVLGDFLSPLVRRRMMRWFQSKNCG